MANFINYKISLYSRDYPDKYNDFVDEMQSWATEVEQARQGEVDLVTNLNTNYVKYTLTSNLDGGATFKCTNMLDATHLQDYVTYKQALGLSGSQSTAISDLSVGSLSANDIVVIDPTGTSISGRSTIYTAAQQTQVLELNKNYNISPVLNNYVSLPAPTTNGSTIGIADLNGVIGTGSVEIRPSSGDSIMWQATNAPLTLDKFKYLSFKLVYITNVGSPTWVITELQR